ncbi:MAG: hypothetical protein U0324_17230 [Polyangiales bacterium]
MHRTLPLLALLAACASPAVVSAPDASSPDASSPDASSPDAPALDAPSPDAPAPDASSPDAPLLPPTDAGPLLPDAGTLGEPPWVPLDVRTTTSCPPLVACGGAVAGTWDVAGGCFDLPVPAELMRCPGARVTSATGRARGRVAFGPAIAARAAQWEVQAELSIPALCAAVVGGCDAIQNAIRGAFPDSACVAEGAARDCRCAVRQTGSLRDGDGYTTMNNQIVSATLNRRWDYCVTGDRLRYRDASTSGAREPGTIELLRRGP